MIKFVLLFTPRAHPNLLPLLRYLNCHNISLRLFVSSGKFDSPELRQYSTIVPISDLNKSFIKREVDLLRSSVCDSGSIDNVVAIVRDSSKHSGQIARIMRSLRVKTFLYDQNEYYLLPSPQSVASELLRIYCTFANFGFIPRRITPSIFYSKRILFMLPRIRTSLFRYPASFILSAPHYPAHLSHVNHPPRISIVGKLWQKRKNHVFLLNALQHVSLNFNLTICGCKYDQNDNKYVSKALHLVETLRSSGKQVDILADIAHHQALEVIGQSDILVLPSLRETFAISILEALVLGVVVIMPRQNGSNWLIKGCPSAFVCPTRPQQLGQLINS